MANQLNSGTKDSLEKGQTLLVNARQIANGKIQLAFAEVLKSDKVQNVLSMLNKSDERFSSKARMSWQSAEPTDAQELLGINFGADAPWYDSERGKMLDLDVLNPTMYDKRCRIVVSETLKGTEWQLENLEKSAKRKGKDGEYITHDGNYIFANTDVILTNESTDALHVYLEPDSANLAITSGKSAVFTAENMDMI
tara:strand:+ start:32 stop:619 length:588 start_codon:yes stop_codon:yes gene_type:complete